MMSLDDAVDLVEHAYKYGKAGDIYVQKAPSSNMLSLAETLKKLFKSKSKKNLLEFDTEKKFTKH